MKKICLLFLLMFIKLSCSTQNISEIISRLPNEFMQCHLPTIQHSHSTIKMSLSRNPITEELIPSREDNPALVREMIIFFMHNMLGDMAESDDETKEEEEEEEEEEELTDITNLIMQQLIYVDETHDETKER